MSSSDSPSEKYSWSFFSLISTKGSTATDFSGMADVAGVGTGTTAAAGRSAEVCFESQNRSTTTYARTTAATPTSGMTARRDRGVNFAVAAGSTTGLVVIPD